MSNFENKRTSKKTFTFLNVFYMSLKVFYIFKVSDMNTLVDSL